jgi:hypothetical protein
MTCVGAETSDVTPLFSAPALRYAFCRAAIRDLPVSRDVQRQRWCLRRAKPKRIKE